MRETVSTYTADAADGRAAEHVVVPSEWTEIEETGSLAFVYALVAALFGAITAILAAVGLTVHFLG